MSETYKIELPLYRDVPRGFRSFISELSNGELCNLANYMVKFDGKKGEERLTFYPFIADEKLRKSSIPVRALSNNLKIPTARESKQISQFSTKFNMLSSVVGARKGRKCIFQMGITEITLENEGKYPKAKAILTVIFETKELALSMAVDNLFKVLSWISVHPGSLLV